MEVQYLSDLPPSARRVAIVPEPLSASDEMVRATLEISLEDWQRHAETNLEKVSVPEQVRLALGISEEAWDQNIEE